MGLNTTKVSIQANIVFQLQQIILEFCQNLLLSGLQRGIRKSLLDLPRNEVYVVDGVSRRAEQPGGGEGLPLLEVLRIKGPWIVAADVAPEHLRASGILEVELQVESLLGRGLADCGEQALVIVAEELGIDLEIHVVRIVELVLVVGADL